MPRLRHAAPIVNFGILSLALTACSKPPADPRVGAQLVRVATVGSAGRADRAFTGIVSARVQSDLGFRVPGKIVARLVDTGQTVRRGQPLMRIDRTDLALATVAQAGNVAAARAKALQTAADEKRYRDLVSAGAVSASAYDQMKAAADSARAELDAAEAQAGVARNQAGYSVLLADADGVVVETLAEPGQVVAAGQTVVRLAHAGPREATISLPETIRPAIGSTASASVFNSSASGTARLRQLSDAADLQTRTYDARYVLEGAAAQAPLGATVTISVPDAKSAGAMDVPMAAIFDNGHGPGVWVVGGSPLNVVWRAVRVASLGDETAIITDGLRPGERFVALGAHYLHQGEAVRIASDQVAGQ
ncbi:efflux RND transporter periplasmic adaptor subunit [Sphingomonas sp. CGMCC 1.13654]|uniref:Efflux RND transporter periplasmic adaptor subunit n=1 Tax=Sphingomonas chungangi TaxID=2683589 RepID=A0A838LAK5_9SPHN|nr:efflux RND transporter periplasmic adaptor subunit [Sphingomonas chungangi]MBA2935910.1 efflux RND transporter periplasmic adaptor subunit [Sphingomonas chungangi]MVW54601.1 efflux RND transporter periplasmic adaptor subunit [Sphingomonas chungangi]